MRFNHIVEMDTLFIRGKPVLHMMDVTMHFSTAPSSYPSSRITSGRRSCKSGIFLRRPPRYYSRGLGQFVCEHEMKASLEGYGFVIR